MDRQFLAVTVVSVLLLVGGIGAGVYLDSTGAFDQRSEVTPAVTYFDGGNATCLPASTEPPSVTVNNDSEGSYLTVEGAIPVSGSRARITNATLDRLDRTTYELSYDTAPRSLDCPAGRAPAVDAQTTVQVPHPGPALFGVELLYPDGTTYRIRKTGDGATIEET
ncbi:hypothetical protein BRD20_01185 [Halobacteriales archaeon SW_8_65_20]|nr:MAG: hypothetical protein BRD20_01185 [Halobacteriales archaeon SW_8_65_20]